MFVPSQCRQATSWRRAAGNYKALSGSLVFTPSAIAVTPMWITEAGTSMNRVYIAHLFVRYRQVVATKRIERCMYTTPGWRVPDSPVEVVANDPKDLTNTQPIRSHLGHIAPHTGYLTQLAHQSPAPLPVLSLPSERFNDSCREHHKQGQSRPSLVICEVVLGLSPVRNQ